jgi:hypothetical protein
MTTEDDPHLHYEVPIPDAIHCDEKDAYMNIIPSHQSQPPSVPRPRVFRSWRWELLSIVFSIGMLAAVFAILAHFNGQQLPQWPLSANLSTLVSILSILFRTAILFVVAEVFGQLRWTLFQKPRPLADLDRIERAGQSAWSAVLLLMRAPKSVLVVLGATVTVVSLAVGPFMQQSIKTFSCVQPVPGTNASLPVGNYISTLAPRVGAGLFDLQVAMKATMINGLANPLGNDSALIFDCPTGNCVFPEDAGITHSSIGMCGSCIDTSSAIPLVNGSVYQDALGAGNITLPNNLTISTNQPIALANKQMINVGLSSIGATDDLIWANAALTADFTTLASRSLYNFTVLSFTTASCDESPDFDACSSSQRTDVNSYTSVSMRPMAVSCTIYSCLKNFHGSVVDAQLQETEVSSKPASPIIEASNSQLPYSQTVNIGNFTAVKEPCLLDGKHYDSSNFSLVDTSTHQFDLITMNGANVSVPLECVYKMRGTYGAGLSQYMRNSLFNGACSGSVGQGATITCPGAFWLEPLWRNGTADLASISGAIKDFATVVTNKLRANSHSLYLNADGSQYLVRDAQGTAYGFTLCTRFEWGWLLLPVVVLILSVVLVVSMMVVNYRSKDQPIWKSSSLPLVLYGFTDGFTARDKLDMDQIDDLAGRTQAQLRTDQVVGFQYIGQ